MSFRFESAWIICQRSWEHHYGHKEIMWSEQYGHKNMLRVRNNRIESGQITKTMDSWTIYWFRSLHRIYQLLQKNILLQRSQNYGVRNYW